MIEYLEETSSNIIERPRASLWMRSYEGDTTTGGEGDYIEHLPFWPVNTMFEQYVPTSLLSLRSAWERISNIENAALAEESQRVLSIMAVVLNHLQNIFDLSFLPSLTVGESEDGFLFEWIFPDYRVGLGIDSDSEESSWFLVSNEKLGSIVAEGSLSDIEPASLILWLISFISLHSSLKYEFSTALY